MWCRVDRELREVCALNVPDNRKCEKSQEENRNEAKYFKSENESQMELGKRSKKGTYPKI